MTVWTDLLGAEVRFHDAGGWRTRAIQAGHDGPVIVMLHGVSGHAEAFCRNVLPLAAAGYRVFAIDALGHGLSAKPEDVIYECPVFVEHIRRFLDAIGAEKAYLVGQSLGGWNAFRFAHQYPERVLGLISLTGAGLRLNDPESDALATDLARQVANVTKKAVDTPTRESVRVRLEWLMASKETVTDELVDIRYQFLSSSEGRRVMPRVSAESTGPGNDEFMLFENVLTEISAPTLFVWSDKNPSMPAHIAERAAKLMKAPLRMVTNAGHWPMFEQPDVVNGLLIDWLKTV